MSELHIESESPISLREHNRTEKRARIREAAREVFCRRGYLHATTREIAARARVANATLFRYASDKRELLLMIINDDLDAMQIDQTCAPAERLKGTVRERILRFYRSRYEYFARYPLISRPFVTESFYFMAANESDVGPEARRNRARRKELIAALAALIDPPDGKRASARLAAELVHAIYLSACREWLESTTPDPREGLKRFDALLRLAAAGFEK